MEKLPEQVMYETFFNLVSDKTNWKNPIDTVINAPKRKDDCEVFCTMIHRAVTFYTGSVATITETSNGPDGQRRLRVRAAGYYNAIGA